MTFNNRRVGRARATASTVCFLCSRSGATTTTVQRLSKLLLLRKMDCDGHAAAFAASLSSIVVGEHSVSSAVAYELSNLEARASAFARRIQTLCGGPGMPRAPRLAYGASLQAALRTPGRMWPARPVGAASSRA